MAETTIEWTHRGGTKGETWNPTTGCDKISPGCDNCYALTMAGRLKSMGQAKYQTDGHPVTSGPGFGLAVHPATLTIPLRWRDPRTVFVNSMSDLFHARVPVDFIARVFAVMAQTPQHTYQILTKRPERAARILSAAAFTEQVQVAIDAMYDDPDDQHVGDGYPLSNVWLGTSVESADYLRRIDDLRETPSAVRFVSAEPLIDPLDGINLAGIDWLIVGGESGPGARPMDLGWVRDLRDRCADAGTALFVKQLGSSWDRRRGKGGDVTSWPVDLRIREWPHAAVDPAR